MLPSIVRSLLYRRPLVPVTVSAVAAAAASSSAVVGATRWYSTKYFTKTHEWVSVEGDRKVGTVGITKYAQHSLTDIVFVDTPSVGTSYEQGECLGAVESVKGSSDYYAPVSGEVLEVSDEKVPYLKINKDPEGAGWLAKMKLSNAEELKTLLNEKQYSDFCAAVDAEGDHH